MIYISAIGMVNALGSSVDEIADNFAHGVSPGMRPRAGWMPGGQDVMLGGVEGELPLVADEYAAHRSRNNQLLLAALSQILSDVEKAVVRFGRSRIAVVLGTSTSGLDESDAYISQSDKRAASSWHYYQQELGDPSRFLSQWLGLDGPAFTISTACSSSARAIISGWRLIEAGLADVALVGGADTLSRMPVTGFHSLEAFSTTLCQPFAKDRRGITIGEGAALMLLGRIASDVALLGAGESSDAYHMSAPHPEGEGASRAIRQALRHAGLAVGDVGYINLHGTATALNDRMESRVIHEIFGKSVPCSSTKHLTGHTLGAAGATEAALCALILQRSLPVPPQFLDDTTLDDTLPDFGLLRRPVSLSKPVVLSNSFAFGGNNVSLVLGKMP